MEWDIDKAFAELEPETAAGTLIQRVYMDAKTMLKYGVEPTEAQKAYGAGTLWCVGLGKSYAAKAFFYGQTIYEAYGKAKAAYDACVLSTHTPWGGEQDWASPKVKQPVSPSKIDLDMAAAEQILLDHGQSIIAQVTGQPRPATKGGATETREKRSKKARSA